MKAERRHELQTNTLAKVLHDLPLYLRFHANKILVGVIVLCVLVLLVRHRINSARLARESTLDALVNARGAVEQLKSVDRTQTNDVARVQERKKIAGEINSAVDQVLQNTSDPADAAIRADAMVLRGDLYWTLANLPALPGAATQPSAMVAQQSPAEYLAASERAYEAVVSKYDAQKVAKASALLGLAAIEENRGNWDKATAYYDSVVKDTGIAQVFKGLAAQRLAMVPLIRVPVYLGSFSSTRPTSEPSTMPTSSPSTLPTPLMSVEPSSRPTSQSMTALPTSQPQ